MESTVNGRKKKATEKPDNEQAKRSKHTENNNIPVEVFSTKYTLLKLH